MKFIAIEKINPWLQFIIINVYVKKAFFPNYYNPKLLILISRTAVLAFFYFRILF